MMNKLTAQDLAPYAHSIECYLCSSDDVFESIMSNVPKGSTYDSVNLIFGRLETVQAYDYCSIIPILRTLDQMTDEEKEFVKKNAHIGEIKLASKPLKDSVRDWIKLSESISINVHCILDEAKVTQYLIQKGFDVFGWIDQGLAIRKED